MVERCKFRVQENFRTFAERLEAYTVEELQLLPRAEWIEISQDFASRNSLPSQQRKYIKYRYNDRLIYDPIIKSDQQYQTRMHFEVLDSAVYPSTNMPWARTLLRFNLIESRNFADATVDVTDVGKPLLYALLKKLADDYPETRVDIERYLQVEREETTTLQFEHLPYGEGRALEDISLEDALKATNEAFAYVFLKYEFEEKMTEVTKIRFFDDKEEPLGTIEIKQGENWLLYDLRFDSLKKRHKAHELRLVDELWMALEALSIKDSSWLSLSAQKTSKVIERVLAHSGWQVNTQRLGETIIYQVEIPGYDKKYVRVIFSPGVTNDQFQISWRLEEQEKGIDSLIAHSPYHPIVRFVAKVAHEIKKGLHKAKEEQSEQVVQNTAVTEQPKSPPENQTITGQKTSLQTKPAGRLPDKVNDEAYQKLLKGNEQQAFDFWCREKKIDNPTGKDRQNFKQSMERARNRNSMTT